MAKYAVPFTQTAWTEVYVEANSPEEAAELADDFPYICAQCSGWGARGNSGIDLSGEWELADDEEPRVVEE